MGSQLKQCKRAMLIYVSALAVGMLVIGVYEYNGIINLNKETPCQSSPCRKS